jgi:hypothetical protein
MRWCVYFKNCWLLMLTNEYEYDNFVEKAFLWKAQMFAHWRHIIVDGGFNLRWIFVAQLVALLIFVAQMVAFCCFNQLVLFCFIFSLLEDDILNGWKLIDFIARILFARELLNFLVVIICSSTFGMVTI